MIRLFFIFMTFFPFLMEAARVRKHSVAKGAHTKGVHKVISPKTRIVIDAGHGGDDFGTKTPGLSGSTIEKILNLKTAEYVAALLRKAGYEVVMTRRRDVFVALADRVEIANRSKAALMVSIHFNAAQSKEAEGLEIYYSKEGSVDRKNSSKKLAESVMQTALQMTKAKSRGVKMANFHVIRYTTIPSILVEGGFLTNERELEKIRQDSYLKALAQGIVEGVNAYFKPKGDAV